MRTILDTAGLPPREAADYWRDVASARLSASRSWTPHDRLRFSAKFEAEELSDLQMLHWRLTPLDGGWAETDGVILLAPRSQVQFADGFDLDGGALCLIDGQRAPRARICEPTEFMGVLIPRTTLARRLNGGLAKVVNRPVAIEGDAALLAEQVRALVRTGPSTLSPAVAVAARMHLLDLAALALAPLAGVAPKLGASAQMIALKLKTAVDAQLANANADRASICAAAGVSERHANRILAQEGTSVIHLLHERRLEKCRLALEKTDRPVAEIAYSCGYADASHFARVFRARYGVTPREHRVSAR
jgi:AraC family transcriptional regulator, positive regulator of tynA and feaB